MNFKIASLKGFSSRLLFQPFIFIHLITLSTGMATKKGPGSILELKSPNSDQHQISPCNINAYSTPEVMRINDMITQGEFSWFFNNFSSVLF